MTTLPLSYPITKPSVKPAWTGKTWAALLSVLSCCTVMVHGYHPLAEDGGLYVTGIEYTLDRSLFPHYTAFVREHLSFSIFAPVTATIVRSTHLSLLSTLFLLNLLSVWMTLFAARQILRRVVPGISSLSQRVQLAGVALLAAWWTMPVAGTSLMLMDPYVTARSFSTPLSLLAIAFALDEWSWPQLRPALQCVLCLAVAGALHPLMAAYGLAFVLTVRASRIDLAFKTRIAAWLTLTFSATVLAALLQVLAPPESAALHAATATRYYWFLSQWQWYEIFGLIGPLAVLCGLTRFRGHKMLPAAATLCHASLVAGSIAAFIALLFAHEASAIHLVARLQVLRLYLLIYAVMPMLIGAALYQSCDDFLQRSRSRITGVTLRLTPAIIITVSAAAMGYVQHQSFPLSQHVELPGRATDSPNSWVQAFLWARTNTPRDALFALDTKYVNTYGEDAQNFRATALRSSLPDYSKDGGEASITPSLAEQWQQGATAQQDLSQLSDVVRDERLRPFGVTWVILHSTALTSHPCPYSNGTVKMCKLEP